MPSLEIGDTYKNKIVLVTGGAGAVGSNLTRALVNYGASVTVIDNLSSGVKSNIDGIQQVKFIEGDITDAEKRDAAYESKPDFVFHLAAFFANQNSVEHPIKDAQANILGTIQLLEKSRDLSVKRFVYANTSCVYNSEGDDWTENSQDIRHETPYSISKFTGEQYAKFFYEFYKLPVTSVRIFNSYGPYEYPGKYRNVIPNFFDLAMRGESLPITGTGEETRSFTYIDDTVRGILLAGVADHKTWEVFNIGSDKETKIIDLAQKINSLTGNTSPIVYLPRRAWDKSLRRKPDIRKAQRLLGFEPSTTIDDGLKHTYEWFKGQKQ